MAPTLYSLFIAVAIVGRIFLHVRRTGDSGIRSDTWKAAGGYGLAGPLLGIGLLANFALCGLESINVLRPQMAPFAWTGVAVGLVGIALTAVAQHQMGAAWRGGVDKSTELVTSGLFARVRNPIYVGVLTFGLGVVLLVPHVLLLAFWLAQVVAVDVIVRRIEEPHLRGVHGADYDEYASRSGRYVPPFRGRE